MKALLVVLIVGGALVFATDAIGVVDWSEFFGSFEIVVDLSPVRSLDTQIAQWLEETTGVNFEWML